MTLYDKIYWQFYPCIDNKVVYLHRKICGFHLTDETINKRYGLSVREINYSSDYDIQEWCDIMNNSYDDCFYDIQKGKKFLSIHPLFQNNKTVIFYKNGTPCASVSFFLGGVKGEPSVGGEFRIGVRNEFKGCGFGRMCVEYAFSRLQEEGYKLGESIITIKRVPSLMLHFSLGFMPRYNMKYVSIRSNLKNINSIQRVRLTFRLFKYYCVYKNKFIESFLK